MRFSTVNLGCKVNNVESEHFGRMMLQAGFEESSLPEADVVIVNTCTVTGIAEKKTRKTVRQVLARSNAESVIVTGCAAVQHPDFFERLSNRVEVVPKWDMDRFLLKRFGNDAKHEADCIPKRRRVGIKVQDGCNNECTYCIVHKLRGPQLSVPVNDVIAQAREIASRGVHEIVLTGINLGSYESDGVKLDGLLNMLVEEGLDCRYRISSIEPTDLTEETIRAVAISKGDICAHLHLPLQSGSSKVLAEMGRPYTADRFTSLIAHVRESIPNVSISTDAIVGFPGETEEEFLETVRVCRECRFSKVHVFPYSEREGTPAASRLDQVPHEIRLERAAKLREVADELRRCELAGRCGTVERAVVEYPGYAMTESYYEVKVDGSLPMGAMIEVRM